MTLRDLMRRDAAALTKLSHLGEAVLYRPAGGGSRTINIVVHRFGVGTNEDTGEVANDMAEALVRNDAVLGTSNPLPGDRYDMPLREGGTPAVAWRFMSLEDHDVALWRIRLEAEA